MFIKKNKLFLSLLLGLISINLNSKADNHDINEILKETLAHEKQAIKVYYELLDLVQDKSVYLEEYARSMIGEEEQHSLELKAMLKDVG